MDVGNPTEEFDFSSDDRSKESNGRWAGEVVRLCLVSLALLVPSTAGQELLLS